MKLRVLISIFFIIATTLSAIHELEHITHSDDSSCLVYHVNDNLTSVDIIDEIKNAEVINFEKIVQNTQVSNLHVKKSTDQNRAPPVLS